MELKALFVFNSLSNWFSKVLTCVFKKSCFLLLFLDFRFEDISLGESIEKLLTFFLAFDSDNK